MSNADASGAVICTVYRSSREAELYLYVKRDEGVSRVPDVLLNRLGTTSEVLTLLLTPERKLARANAADVLRSLHDNGYYLQLPPDFNVNRYTQGG